ncbi:MAG: hypothetical protein ABIJ18_04910 [archaeon]
MARSKPEEFDELVIGKQKIRKNKVFKKLRKKDVKKWFVSEVRSFAKSGAYIPCSGDYSNHTVYVVVLEEKKK